MQTGPLGLTEAQIAEFGMTWGVGGFTFILFFVLAFGILGFVAKQVIQWLIGIE